MIILKKWPSSAFIKQLECKKMSNEAVKPQISYWFSRKDHIRNSRGKKKPRKLSSETGVLSNDCLVPGKVSETFFSEYGKQNLFSSGNTCEAFMYYHMWSDNFQIMSV